MTIEYKDFRIRHLPDDLPLLSSESAHPEGSLASDPRAAFRPIVTLSIASHDLLDFFSATAFQTLGG